MLYQLSYSRIIPLSIRGVDSRGISWGVVDSNHRSRKTTDLQSVPFGHSGNSPDLLLRGPHVKMEPVEGFEPPTSWLQISCSGQLSYTGRKIRYFKELPTFKTSPVFLNRGANVVIFSIATSVRLIFFLRYQHLGAYISATCWMLKL